MKRLLIPGIAALAVVLAACGSDGGAKSSSNTSNSTPAASAATVTVADSAGIGKILVDSSGNALYSPDEEANGTIVCVDTCITFWRPLAAGSATPTAGAGAPSLGVITRPDGGKQVAVDGHPLYTFSQDSPGKVTGNGFADDFGGQHFTWHVVMADGSIAGAPSAPMPTTPGGGYGY
jgi:predicted lipoprotein with Yx(FWY)xxD motif